LTPSGECWGRQYYGFVEWQSRLTANFAGTGIKDL
jgi:hypothetical protein